MARPNYLLVVDVAVDSNLWAYDTALCEVNFLSIYELTRRESSSE